MAAATAERTTAATSANAGLDLLARVDQVNARAISYSPIQMDDDPRIQASPLALKLATRTLELREEISILTVKITFADPELRAELSKSIKRLGAEYSVVRQLFGYQLQSETGEWALPLTMRGDGVIVVTALDAAQHEETFSSLSKLSDQAVERFAGGSPETVCTCPFCQAAAALRGGSDEDDVPPEVKEVMRQLFGGAVRIFRRGG